jgi:eukaryotic-like serine/threonine-protein kinase
MPLAAGARIGGYEVLALVGAGGMGEVYRARDARLGRDIAIKIVSPAIAADASGLMRFEREARMLGALNHPNIAAIYGVEDGAGAPALILELVDGETLAERIARGPIPVAEALGYTRQIADALDTAHEAGIVHRDLKPGNIKITEDGRVKVLDFGLAKAIAAATTPDPAVDPAHSPTITIHGTKGGVILGTAAYMSPEQARGKTIDKRTDIWAFGCVLYEMLTGRRAFGGETTSDVIAAIIERQPDLAALPPSVPAPVRRVITRCLEKDPKRRARDIAEVALQLADGVTTVASQTVAWRPAAAIAVVFLILGALGSALVVQRMTRSIAVPIPVEFTFGAPPNHTLVESPASVSPDGRHIVFVARDARDVPALWVRSLDEAPPRRLDATEGAATTGIWSPNGESIAFLIGTTWKRVRLDGGPATTIVSEVVANLGASWGSDDVILMAPANRTALARVPASGGALEPVTTLDPTKENSHRWPQILPDGRRFLFTVRSDRPENLGIKLGSFDSREVRTLVNMPSPGRFAPPGWLLFMTPDQVLMAQPLDPKTWTLSGTPQPVAAPVRYNGPSFSGVFAVSGDGRVLTYSRSSRPAATLKWFDRSGKLLGKVGPERDYDGLRLSPTNRTVAVELADERYGTRDLWLIDTATQVLTRLTTNAATDWRPVFAPDGSAIAFASDRAGVSTIFRVATSGDGAETLMYRHSTGGAFPVDWSRDGKYVLAQTEEAEGRRGSLLLVPVAGGPPVSLIEGEPYALAMARLSPQGDLVAFAADTTGTREIYVMSIDDRRRVRVSTDGGWHPHWGRDNGELFFQTPRGELMRAVLDRNALAVTASPAPLLRPCADASSFFVSGPSQITYDLTSDGARILAICSPQDARPSTMTVVVNWQSKLR